MERGKGDAVYTAADMWWFPSSLAGAYEFRLNLWLKVILLLLPICHFQARKQKAHKTTSKVTKFQWIIKVKGKDVELLFLKEERGFVRKYKPKKLERV